MKVSGTAHLSADRGTVFDAFQSPEMLVRTLPGCQTLEVTGPGAYRMRVAAGVGSIKGVYDGAVKLSDLDEPSSFRMNAQGAGAPGTIGADVVVTLADGPDGGTDLTYDADAVVGGMIGGVGQRMLTGVSKKMAAEFFRNVDRALAGADAAGVPVGSDAAVPPTLAGSGGRPSEAWPDGVVGGAVAGDQAGAGVGAVFTAPQTSAPAGSNQGFLVGVATGAGIALAGVLVGAWVAGRRRR